MDKKYFSYTDENGDVQTDIELYNDTETSDYYDSLVVMQTRFYLLQGYNEKIWRNSEFDLTDKLLQVDSTYNNTLVSSSTMLDEILAYRAELRSYAYDTSDPRPTRPTWYKG